MSALKLVCLSNRGHYPDEWVLITAEEAARLKRIADKHGCLSSQRLTAEEAEFVERMRGFKTVKPQWMTVTLYE